MKSDNYIVPLNAKLSIESIGNKADSLLFLKKHGFRIPMSFVVLESAFSDYCMKKNEVTEKVRAELEKLPDNSFAVRSSTSFEDATDFSHAGQFETILNVSGTDKILQAITKVWESAIPKLGDRYFEKTGNTKSVRCAVIIQEMVDSKLAGVSFSKNPVNNLHEIIIEAIEGTGENLVQRGTTPLRWIYRNGKLVKGDASFYEIGIIEKIEAATSKLKKKFKNDVDIEWAFDGKELYLLQIRSVTTKASLTIYSNKMAKEMLPGQIKPLVWSLNIPLVNGAWIKILEKVIGMCRFQPEDFAKPFYFRTYFNVTNLAAVFSEFGVPFESIEEMMLDESKTKHTFKPGLKTVKHTFRLIKFIFWILRFEKFFLNDFPILKKQVKDLGKNIEQNNSIVSQFNDLYKELFVVVQKLAHFNIITPLLMRAYSKNLKKKIEKLGANFEEINFNIDFPAMKNLSPLAQMAEIKKKFDQLPEEIRNKSNSYQHFSEQSESQPIIKLIQSFVEDFGHHSESGNDISHPKWEEDLDFVFKMIVDSVEINSNSQQIYFSDLQIPLLKRRRYQKSYQKAGRFALYREQISSLYIHGYGLFRKLYLKIANDFIDRNIIDERDDIFFLHKGEIQKNLQDRNIPTADWKKVIQKRKAEYTETKDVVLPSVIYGEEAPVIEHGSIKNFIGVATSSGTFKGKTKVINHVSDFNKVVEGDVVIIPFSDVSWTPVLVKAGAIVSEAGGMLSHCSIIAREMGIPALVSVDNACSLDDDLLVTVNGSNGVLTIHDYE